MTSWAERMHRRAATFSSVVTSCGHSTTVPFPRRLEKVKFGVPLDEVCKNDIPGPLLVLILKLNKEAPYKKDVFRAPGHQGNMKQLIHFLQAGRLVNMDNFSVYTIASVLKKFLRKLPGGIFGQDGEQSLFSIIDAESVEQRRDEIHRLVTALPAHTQRLLILLFGTFRMIASNAERACTGMTAEALGVSVAPSFFQSCVRGSKPVKMEDVHRFKVATRIMKFLIENFGVSNLFGRDNYEFYARITGRILKVEEDWIFSFRYPPETLVSRQLSLEAEKSWFKYECERWGLKFNLEAMSRQEESQSAPALNQAAYDPGATSSSLGTIPENNRASRAEDMTLEELRAINRYAESTRSLSFLPQVHERQAARMRTRSEWFLADQLRRQRSSSSGSLVTTTSGESIRRASFRRRREHHRSSSRRKNKENGSKPVQQTPPKTSLQSQLKKQSSLDENVTEQDCTEIDVHTFHVTLTYKPRI